MRKTMGMAGALLLAATTACAGRGGDGEMGPVPGATATLLDAQGSAVANAVLTEVDDGVRIDVSASGLPPGTHGFHVHETGQCDAPDFTSAGGHFNPTSRSHGLQSAGGHHVGDLPNLVVSADGTAQAEVVAHGATLRGSGDRSLLAGNGTALVIHAGADDMRSDPSGNSGPRIACGVIRARDS